MDKILDGLAPYFLHVSYVVRDLDATRRSFESLMGVKFGTKDFPMGPPLEMRGRPVTIPFVLRASIGRTGATGDTEIELIQPAIIGDDIYSEFIKTTGGGMHHMAFLVPNWEQATRALRAAGIPILLDNHAGDLRYSYFDLRTSVGSVIEIVQYDQATYQMIEDLKGTRQFG
jgi:methylmalonyl-CoA/ethylmalonyl-CoA epimerase